MKLESIKPLNRTRGPTLRWPVSSSRTALTTVAGASLSPRPQKVQKEPPLLSGSALTAATSCRKCTKPAPTHSWLAFWSTRRRRRIARKKSRSSTITGLTRSTPWLRRSARKTIRLYTQALKPSLPTMRKLVKFHHQLPPGQTCPWSYLEHSRPMSWHWCSRRSSLASSRSSDRLRRKSRTIAWSARKAIAALVRALQL